MCFPWLTGKPKQELLTQTIIYQDKALSCDTSVNWKYKKKKFTLVGLSFVLGLTESH